MAFTTERSVELHKIIISGIGTNANYFRFIKYLHSLLNRDITKTPLNINGKKHVLKYTDEGTPDMPYKQIIFYSYKAGNRPDVVNESNQEIEENPLNINQALIEWTHILIEKSNNYWYLVIEKHSQGIYPKTIEKYLQLLCNKYVNIGNIDVIINIEPVPSPEFIIRLDNLSVIKSAKIKYSRPNPTNWDELDGLLNSGVADSNASKATVEMIAARNDGLSQVNGIVGEIKSRYYAETLGFASIIGKTEDGKEDSFSTEKLIKKDRVQVETNENGQVDKQSIFRRLSSFLTTGD